MATPIPIKLLFIDRASVERQTSIGHPFCFIDTEQCEHVVEVPLPPEQIHWSPKEIIHDHVARHPDFFFPFTNDSQYDVFALTLQLHTDKDDAPAMDEP